MGSVTTRRPAGCCAPARQWQALAWAAARLGGPVISARALRGGMSSAMHLLTLRGNGGQRRQAVLRRYVRPELNADEPDIAVREARALRVAESVDVPTPSLLAVDPAGDEAGVPAVLMSRLPGRVEWWPPDMDRWLSRLAGVLPHIHAAPLPPAGIAPAFRPVSAGQLPATGLGALPGRVGTSRRDQPAAPRLSCRRSCCTATSTPAMSCGDAAPCAGWSTGWAPAPARRWPTWRTAG